MAQSASNPNPNDKIDKRLLSEAARSIDAVSEEVNDIASVLESLGVNQADALECAMQRATRVYAILTGQPRPGDISKFNPPVGVKVDPAILAAYASIWLDGLTIAMKAVQLQNLDRPDSKHDEPEPQGSA